MSQRRSGEHHGHSYRCWLEISQGRYRGWFRGKLAMVVTGDRNFVDRLHAQTPWFDTAEEALDEAEQRVKAVIDEVAAAAKADD